MSKEFKAEEELVLTQEEKKESVKKVKKNNLHQRNYLLKEN